MKKRKRRNSGWLVFLLSILLGAGCGVIIARTAREAGPDGYMAATVLMYLGFLGVHFLQVAVHEAGHLVFGLLTGYEFISYRVGSLMVLRQDGRLRLRRYGMRGTGGQCLMGPPELKDGKMPVMLYNLGGSIMNLLSCLVLVMLCMLTPEGSLLRGILLMGITMGLLHALTNGIPARTALIHNDGYNALTLWKHPEAIPALRTQLMVSERLSRGQTLAQMPEEWFEMPNEEQMKVSFQAAIAAYRVEYLMEQLRLEEALDLVARVLAMDSGLVGVQRNELIMNRVYCDMMLGEAGGSYGRLGRKDFDRLLRLGRGSTAALRCDYAYAVLVEKDEKKAAKILKRFDKLTAKYPYPQLAELERKYMALARQKGEETVC